MTLAAGLPEQLVATLGPHGLTRTRRMFGGIALYHNAQVFGIAFDGALYLRVNEVTRKAYERAGMPTLQIPGMPKPTMRYMKVPPAVMENAASLRAWARQSIATSAVDSPGARKAARGAPK